MTSRAFAAAISRRHAGGTARWPRASLVLCRATPRAVHRAAAVVLHRHSHAGARLQLHLRHGPMDARRSFITLRQQVIVRNTAARTMPRTAIDPPDPIAQAVPSRAPSAPMAASQVPMVTRRGPAFDRPSESPSRQASREPSRDAATPPVRPAPVNLPAVELDRVTDHVLRSLDRRLGSWRDRRGRS